VPAEQPAATFLFTDIEGSTRLWERAPAAMQQALAQHDGWCRDAVQAHRGRIVKGTGDGIHAVFDDPADALQAALQLQLTLAAAEAAGGPGLALRVRCGLHGGPVEQRDGDFYGSVVNRAARIMSIAHGGQTLLSQALADQLQGRLPAPTTLQPLGAVRLRDLSSPETVHQLVHPGLRQRFPPLRSLEATPNNLAQQLDSFVGRERELAELRGLLARCRLLTLAGMGGIGKSRLSVQLGAELLDEFADGVWLVELAPLSDPRRVPQVVAQVLGVREEAGQPLIDSLRAHVRERRLLLILDNCEHLLPACAGLAKQLLQAGPGVKVLASSRDVLQLAGETTYPVPALSVPDARAGADPGALMRHEAVRLFVDRARAAQAAFTLDAGNAEAVAQICQRLDGIPLALELAAARTRALPVQAIAQRLSDRFRLLVSGDQTVLPRQRTLRALIDWSHELLSAPERELFARLAVFAGGWTLEAAEAVGGGDGLDPEQVLDLLAQLVGKSLVVLDAGAARYRMLETVRAYAEEKLAAGGHGAATRNRHLQHLVLQAEAARPQLAGPEQGRWLARLDTERDNFLAAQRWSEQAADGDALGLRLLHALRPYWINRGDLSLGLDLALELLARPGLQRRDAARCMALFSAGQIGFMMGRHAQAREHLEECLAIARECGEAAIVARVLQPLGMTQLALHDFDAASGSLSEALERAEVQGEPRELAAALNALAMLHRLQGRPDRAEPICQRAVALVRALGDQENIGVGLLSLAMVRIQLGRTAGVGTMLREVAEVARQTGSQPMQHGALEVASGLAAALARWDDAAAFYGAAQGRREASGLRRDAADEAFMAAAIDTTRQALGAEPSRRLEAAGRARSPDDLLAWLDAWLAGVD
jgi:predicted ATPase/class 3 adenylate cyclase